MWFLDAVSTFHCQWTCATQNANESFRLKRWQQMEAYMSQKEEQKITRDRIYRDKHKRLLPLNFVKIYRTQSKIVTLCGLWHCIHTIHRTTTAARMGGSDEWMYVLVSLTFYTNNHTINSAIQLSSEKEWSIDAQNNMGEFQNNNSEWEETEKNT